MSDGSGFGKQIFDDLSKVRVTRGKLELPVRANSEDGVQIGSYRLPKPDPKPEGPARRRGLFARLFRRRSA